jgi:hypothetical protein
MVSDTVSTLKRQVSLPGPGAILETRFHGGTSERVYRRTRVVG